MFVQKLFHLLLKGTNDVDESTVIDQDISVSNATYIDSEYVIEINFSEQWT